MTRRDVMLRLRVSPATFKRDLVKLREQMDVPVRFDRETGRYRVDGVAPKTAKPNLWFDAKEVHDLLTIRRLFSELESGVLGARLKPLQERLDQLLETSGLGVNEMSARVHIVEDGGASATPELFDAAAAATMARKRLKVKLSKNGTDEADGCETSPQRLVFYRGAWYLDAWCHEHDDFHSIAIDKILAVEAMDADAIDIAPAVMEHKLGATYA